MASSKRSSPLPRIVFRLTAPAISAAADVACGTSPTKRSCGKSSAGYRMPCGASAAMRWNRCRSYPPLAMTVTAIRRNSPLAGMKTAAIPAFLRRAAIPLSPAGIVPSSLLCSARLPDGCAAMPMRTVSPSMMKEPQGAAAASLSASGGRRWQHYALPCHQWR